MPLGLKGLPVPKTDLPLFRQVPLVPIALALCAGLIAGFHFALPWWAWAATALTALLLARRWERALLVVALASGGWLAAGDPRNLSPPPVDPTRQYVLKGIVRQVHVAPDRTQLTLKFLAGLPDSVVARRGLWRIYHDQRQPTLQEQALLPGDTLLLQGRLARPRGRRNPNGFDYRFYLWSRGIDLLIREPVVLLAVDPPRGFHLSRVTAQLRRGIRARLEHWLGQPQAGLAVGLLLGDRGGIDNDFRRRINDLGVGHILAVSGLHVGFIALVLVTLARILPIGRNGRLAVVSLGLLGYVVLTGAPPSVVRAGIMAFLVLWGRTLERPVSLWNLLGAAAIASLLMNPRTLFTASFQLSFAAVAGILHVSLRLRAWIKATPRGAWLYQWRAARFALDLLLISLGAQVGTLPVTLSIFHAFSAYALLANLLAVPLAGFAVVGGAVSFIAAAVWPALGDIFAQALWLDLTVLMLAVEQLSRLPHPQVLVGQPGAAATLILLA
ncbi:MAG: ComEC/Rec2 family competence protein, partial [Candidatus Marinimicrobia bacterium]|nr:ComEC/Rec2 family competence protein [Candidatus Neomarinimicrobiota bacterium]